MLDHADNLEEAILKADHAKCEELLKKIAEEDNGKNLPLAEEKVLDILNTKYFPSKKIENKLPLRSVDDEMRMWKVLNKYCKKVNLENVTADFFVKFWFEKPEFALELLEETIKQNNSFKFKKWISDNIIFLNYQYIPPLNNNEAFAKCLRHLYQLGFSMPSKFKIALLQTDFGAALYPEDTKVTVYRHDLEFIMHWDSKDCLERANHLSNNQVKNYSPLSMAVNNSACECVSLILSKKMHEENIDNVINTALKDGRGYMVYLLCEKDLKRTADLIFSQSDFDNLVTTFMFTPLDFMQQAFEKYKESHPEDKTVTETYNKALTYFKSIAPYFARYHREQDLRSLLEQAHGITASYNFKNFIKKNRELGEHRRDFVDNLTKHIEAITQSGPEWMTKIKDPFKNEKLFPASSNKSRLAVYCLQEYVKDNEARKRGGLFSTIRDAGRVITPQSGLYAWGAILSRYEYDQSDKSKVGIGYEILNETNNNEAYVPVSSLKVEEQEESDYPLAYWCHGLAKLETVWPDIENIFEEIINMNLKKPSDDASTLAKEAYQNKLTQFYEKVAELVWRIGTTTPLARGSGSFAENMFALCHKFHGLEIPILKLDFPQLDVLDINFHLDRYKKIFPYFFEPATIPPHLRIEAKPFAPSHKQLAYVCEAVEKGKKKDLKTEKGLFKTSVVEEKSETKEPSKTPPSLGKEGRH